MFLIAKQLLRRSSTLWAVVLLVGFVMCVLPDLVHAAQSVRMEYSNDSTSTDSSNVQPSKKNYLWLMAAFSLDLEAPNVGGDLNVIGVLYKIGAVLDNRIFLFVTHSTSGSFFDINEYRNDYAFLYGVSYRTDGVFMNASAGISFVNYYRHGVLISPGTNSSNGTYELLSGTAVGLAAEVDVYLCPIKYWGLFGLGLYGSLSKSESYFSFEIAFPLEFNIPIPLRSDGDSPYPN